VAWAEDLLVELVAAPDEESGQRVMARAWAEIGLEPVDVFLDVDALRADPHSSPFSWDVSGKRNVVATWKGSGGGRSLILNGHIDVVPPANEELWTSPPFEARVDGDWIYGRGAGDMKAGLVAMTAAVKAVRDAGVELAGDVVLQSVVEEECTGNGTLQCLLDGYAADAAVLTEPHPDHLTVAQVGVLWFHVDIGGVPAHAARKALGFNALDTAYEVLTSLRALERELNVSRPAPYDAFEHPINLNPGVMTAGDWPSTVAAKCTLSCRLACYPGEDPRELQRRVEAAVAHADATARVRYDGFVCEGSVVAADEPLVQVLSDAYASVHGDAPALEATTATTDARHFVRRGIPAVCYGPRAERIHGIDERVSRTSMAECAEVLAQFVKQWCEERKDRRAPVHATSGGENRGDHR
jgi:acetylornithine deacetylase